MSKKISSIKKYKPKSNDKILSLEDCQQILLKILYTFQCFCDDNKLVFSLAYGSLIGAAREKNIIKWDNDIDIMMSQTEFDKLFSIIDKLEDYGMYYYHYSNATHVYSGEIRIYFKGFYRLLESDCSKYITPLCIDVFPLVKIDVDSSGKIASETKKKIKKLNKIKKLFYLKEVKHKSKNLFNKITKLVARPFLFCVSSSMLHKKMENITRRLHTGNHDYMLFSPNASWFRLFENNMFDKMTTLQFGSEKVSSISEYDYFLTNVYGDWKKPHDRSDGRIYKTQYLSRSE